MNIKNVGKLAIFICAATALTASLVCDKKNKECTKDTDKNEETK